MAKLKAAHIVLAFSAMLTFSGMLVEAKPTHSKLSRIDAVFRLDMLNSNKDYVENIIGPAKYIVPSSLQEKVEIRDYLVDGCNIEVAYKATMVVYLGLKGVSPHCQFPLRRFIPHTPAQKIDELSKLTFDMFETEVGAGIQKNFYGVECLGSCGNSADPSVSLYHEGAHVDEFIKIFVQEDYPYADQVSDSAFNELEGVLLKQESGDYVAYGRVKCDPKYQPLERQLFKNSRVKNVFVGFDLSALAPSCRD